MGRKADIPSVVEIQSQITQALRRSALRPSIAGYRPQDHQIPFHKSQKKGRLAIGGNRSGKTVAGGAEAVMWLSGKHIYWEKFPTPVRGRAVGVDFDQGIKKIILPEIARWIPPSLLINGSWEDSYSKGDRVLTLTNGSTCEFMSYDQDVAKFAGTSRHFVWFDEEPPEDIFNENMMRLVDTGGHWWLTMTPLFEMSWTYDRLYDAGRTGLNPDIGVFELVTSQNSYVNSAEIDVLTEGLDEFEKAARLKGTYISQSGTIYGKSLSERNFIPSITSSDVWPIYYNTWSHFGMLDHGYRNPTAFLLGAVNDEGRIVIYKEYYATGKLVGENAASINEIIKELKLEDKLKYIVADPSIRNTDPIAGGSIQQAYSEHGIYLSLGNNDVDAGINRVQARFKSGDLLITEDCKMLIWESHRYRWDKYTNSKTAGRHNLKETPLKKDDHAMDALRYGVVSRPALDGEVEVRQGNFLNLPSAIVGDYKDTELLVKSMEYQNNGVYDITLGSDW